MKEYLKEWMARKKEFQAQEKSVGEMFVDKILTSLPDWRDRLGSIYLSTGYGKSDAGEGAYFIPRVRDIDYYDDDRIKFKIKVADGGYGMWVDLGPFPISWITDPNTLPFDQQYLKGKIQRRQDYLKDTISEMESLEGEKKRLEEEISDLQLLLSKTHS